ncbi:hypothetical protein OFC37_28995, partial [Escherichia coli]|nr:hypothetical protein [Escherichia coli]
NMTTQNYEIAAVTKCLLVLEALEGVRFEPVSISTICGRTGLTRDFVFRALCTLKLRGYVERLPNGKWSVGKRFLRFATNAATLTQTL